MVWTFLHFPLFYTEITLILSEKTRRLVRGNINNFIWLSLQCHAFSRGLPDYSQSLCYSSGFVAVVTYGKCIHYLTVVRPAREQTHLHTLGEIPAPVVQYKYLPSSGETSHRANTSSHSGGNPCSCSTISNKSSASAL